MGNTSKILQLYSMLLTGNGLYFYEDFKDVIFWKKHFRELDINELKGKNLACWCKHGNPCHADILLKLANKNKQK